MAAVADRAEGVDARQLAKRSQRRGFTGEIERALPQSIRFVRVVHRPGRIAQIVEHLGKTEIEELPPAGVECAIAMQRDHGAHAIGLLLELLVLRQPVERQRVVGLDSQRLDELVGGLRHIAARGEHRRKIVPDRRHIGGQRNGPAHFRDGLLDVTPGLPHCHGMAGERRDVARKPSQDGFGLPRGLREALLAQQSPRDIQLIQRYGHDTPCQRATQPFNRSATKPKINPGNIITAAPCRQLTVSLACDACSYVPSYRA